jgi:hypothetical protein
MDIGGALHQILKLMLRQFHYPIWMLLFIIKMTRKIQAIQFVALKTIKISISIFIEINNIAKRKNRKKSKNMFSGAGMGN